jgi:hypothetical protein
MLIDTRTPPPERPAWQPNWRLWSWVAAAIVACVAADSTSGLVAYVLICAALAFVCQAISVVTPSLDGLRQYRQ